MRFCFPPFFLWRQPMLWFSRFYYTACATFIFILAVNSQALAQIDTVQSYADLHANGWPAQLEALKLPRDQNLFIIMFAAPNMPIDFTTNNSVRESIYRNPAGGSLSQLSLGHTMLAWQCQKSWGVDRGATAMTGEQHDQTRKMLASGWGVTPLFSVFTDGFLESSTHLQEVTLKTFVEDGNLQTLLLHVEGSDCDKLQIFLKTFIDLHPLAKTRFGLTPDPSNFEGGGCGSFAFSALRSAGVLPGLLPLLWRRMSFPKGLFGCRASSSALPGQVQTPCRTGTPDRSVSMMWMSFMDWTSNDNHTDVPVQFVDPFLVKFMMDSFAQPEIPPQMPAPLFRQFGADRGTEALSSALARILPRFQIRIRSSAMGRVIEAAP